MISVKKLVASLAICAMAMTSSVGLVMAQTVGVTIGQYFNELSQQQRHEFKVDVSQKEIQKMLKSGRVAEVGCVAEKLARQPDGAPGSGAVFMEDVLGLANKQGKTEQDAERLIRGVMVVLYKQCIKELKKK